MKMQVSKAVIGIVRREVKMSSTSITPLSANSGTASNGWNHESIPVDRAERTPSTSPAKAMMTEANWRRRPNLSISQAVGTSSSEIELVSAAKPTMMKNNRPISDPKGIS